MGDLSNFDSVDRQWDSGAPDLRAAFPSLDQQVKEYPAIESKVADAAYVAMSPSDAPSTNDGQISQEPSKWKLMLGGASYHIGAREYTDKDTGEIRGFNEINPGIGVERSVTDHISLAAGVYNNSYHQTSAYGLVYLHTDPLTETGKLTVGVDVGVVSGYDGYIDERLIIGDTGVAVMVSPYASVEISDSDDNLLPKGTDIKANIIPGEGLLGSDSPNAVDAAVGVSMRVPF